jgi:hypothetical protein
LFRRSAPVLLAALVCTWAFCAYALAARFALHGPVTPTSLYASVAARAGSAGGDAGRCRRAGAAWSCLVSDREGSGGGEYRVRVRAGSSCFDGRLTRDASEDGDMPRRVQGCIHLWQWRLLT